MRPMLLVALGILFLAFGSSTFGIGLRLPANVNKFQFHPQLVSALDQERDNPNPQKTLIMARYGPRKARSLREDPLLADVSSIIMPLDGIVRRDGNLMASPILLRTVPFDFRRGSDYPKGQQVLGNRRGAQRQSQDETLFDLLVNK